MALLPIDGETAVHGGAATLAPAAADAKGTAATLGGGGFGGKSQHFKVADRCGLGSKGGYDMALENIFILFFVYAYYSTHYTIHT